MPVASTAPFAGEQECVPSDCAAVTVHRAVATWVVVFVAVRVTLPVGVPAEVGVTARVGVKLAVASWPGLAEVWLRGLKVLK